MKIKPEDNRDPPNTQKRSTNLLVIGFLLTTAWLGSLALYYWRHTCEFQKLTPNEVGDILAGWFAPLAFIWLSIAVLLQKFELEAHRFELRQTREFSSEQRMITRIRSQIDDLGRQCIQMFDGAILSQQGSQLSIDAALLQRAQKLSSEGASQDLIDLAASRMTISSQQLGISTLPEPAIATMRPLVMSLAESAADLIASIDSGPAMLALFRSVRNSSSRLQHAANAMTPHLMSASGADQTTDNLSSNANAESPDATET